MAPAEKTGRVRGLLCHRLPACYMACHTESGTTENVGHPKPHKHGTQRPSASLRFPCGLPAIGVHVKGLLVPLYFRPAGGGGVQRPLKFATHLPALGIETHVLAPDDPKWVHRDDDLVPPTQAWVHRVRYLGPKGRLPAEELHGVTGIERAVRKSALAFRRVLVPDEN